MILHSETLYKLANIDTATLDEYATGEGTLGLSFAGFGPEWLNYMQPVTLYHKGKVLFHGKITSLSRTNDGGAITRTATISNFMWLLDRQTLGQQVAEIEAAAKESANGSRVDVSRSLKFTAGQIGKSTAGSTGVTWGSITGSMGVTSEGWTAEDTTGTTGGGTLTVRASSSVAGRAVWAVTDKLITTASALVKLRERAADVQYIMDYSAGTCTAMAIGDMPTQTWDTGARGITSISDISPQYEACVTGVAVVWTSDEGKVEVHAYPPGLDMAQDGVKVFSLTGAYYVASWDAVARDYYKAANVLQWGGSITALQSHIDASPLGCKLNLTGPGTHESWHTMEAVVTQCSWDFMERTLTVTLGRDFADPEFTDAQETEDGGEEEEIYTTNDDWPDDEWPDDWPDTTEDGGDDWPDTTGTELPTWEPGTWPDMTGSNPSSLPGTGTGTGSIGSSSHSGGTSTQGEGSQGGGTQGEGSQDGGSQGGGSQGGGSQGGGSGACDCSNKWEELKEWQQKIEERITKLEKAMDGTGGGSVGCNCACSGLLEEIQRAVQTAAAGVSLTATISAPVMTTETGDLTATASASAAGGSGNSSVNFHY